MKKAAICVLALFALLFTSCGIPADVQKQLTDLQSENKQWKELDKPALEKQLAAAQAQATANVTASSKQITDLQSQVQSLNKQASDFQTQVQSIQSLNKQISDLQSQLAKYPNVKDPTYGDATTFLKGDDTDKKGLTGSAASLTIAQNAWKAGLYAHFVGVYFPTATNQWTSVVGFNTPDKGWVYFSPTNKAERILEVGKKYADLNKLTAAPFDDTIQSIFVFP